MKADVEKYRANLIEAVAEYDDNLLEKFFDNPDSITEDEIHEALRKAAQDMSIIPMVCGSAFKNKGVQFLLDCVCRYLPSPEDKEAIVGTNRMTILRFQENQRSVNHFQLWLLKLQQTLMLED